MFGAALDFTVCDSFSWGCVDAASANSTLREIADFSSRYFEVSIRYRRCSGGDPKASWHTHSSSYMYHSHDASGVVALLLMPSPGTFVR